MKELIFTIKIKVEDSFLDTDDFKDLNDSIVNNSFDRSLRDYKHIKKCETKLEIDGE